MIKEGIIEKYIKLSYQKLQKNRTSDAIFHKALTSLLIISAW